MGKYAIYRRRGTAPATVPTPPPVPLNVTLVQVLDSSHCIIQFDGDPLCTTGVADGSFLVNGGGMDNVTDLGAGQVLCDAGVSGPVMNAGDPWDIVSQPAWAAAPILNPQSGLCF